MSKCPNLHCISNRFGIVVSVIAFSIFNVFKNGPMMVQFKTCLYHKNIFLIKMLNGFGKFIIMMIDLEYIWNYIMLLRYALIQLTKNQH